MAVPNAQYTFAAPRRQLFSLPFGTMSSMLENPSSHKGLMKLYQTCKHFYGKRPILIVDQVRYYADMEEDTEVLDTQIAFMERWKSISQLQVPLWLTHGVQIEQCCDHRLPKLFRSSVKAFVFRCGYLQYEDFVVLASEKNILYFETLHNAVISRPNEKKFASIPDVLQHLPNVRHFTYDIEENCSLETLTKLKEIKMNSKFSYLSLCFMGVHPTFDFNLFCEFIMKNSNEESIIEIVFQEFLKEQVKEKLRVGLAKMDAKWRTDAHEGLKNWFLEIEA